MASSLNGTGLTFSTGATLNSPPVTSVATSGGITGGTITTTGTISLDTNNYNGVGSISTFWCSYGTQTNPGATISGSYLFYVTAVSTNAAGSQGTSYGNYQSLAGANYVNRTTSLSGVSGSGTLTPVGGTWRLISPLFKASYTAGCCGGGTTWGPVLAIRTA